MKQSRLIQKAKRVIAGVIALAMTVTMFPAASVVAQEPQEKYPYTLFAASEEEGAITITGNTCVNGNIATNGTATVTGSAVNVNGTVTEQAKEKMIDISAKLDEVCFAGEAVEYYTENFVSRDVNCNISNPTVVPGNMEVKGNVNLNASVKASENITFEADSLNGNHAVIYSENGDISIFGNNVNFTGLLYAPKGKVSITAQYVNLNSVIVIADKITIEADYVNINYNQRMAETVGVNSGEETEEPDTDATVLFLLGKYNEENHSIDMEWYTNATKPEVTVWLSADNGAYEKVATVTEETNYQYIITKEFETAYFKASIAGEQGKTVETVPFVVAKTEGGYVVNSLDSDKDGIADEYEILAGTDKSKPDTDGDTLTDYEELYLSHTDAVKFDSVTEGVSDGEADSDGDRLSNREEITYATQVQNPDTDSDTLTDYEEIEVYHTDPLNADTDGDTVKDGDEIALGLDPLNPATFGVPDGEYRVEQTIDAESEALREINTDENAYRLSVAVTASGYVEGNLTAKETGYAAAIQNEFMVGTAAELSYVKEDGIDSVTLSFELDEETIGDSLGLFPGVEELSGIKRFNVFKYFEEINMLLPIETVVDEENNRISATTDELGTYCVMDMELWLASFDVPEEVYPETPVMFSLRPETSAEESTEESTEERIIIDCVGTPLDMEPVEEQSGVDASEEEEVLTEAPMMFALKRDVDKTPLDVVFLLQSSGQLENTFESQKEMICELLDNLGARYGRGNVRFAVISYGLSGAKFITSPEGEIWFSLSNGLRQALYYLEYEYTSGYTDRGTALKKLQNEVVFRENASKFIFQVMNGSTDVGDMYFDQIETCTRLGINYSEMMPEGYHYLDPSYGERVENAIASTNGINITYGETSQLEVYQHIVACAAPPQMEFDAIVPTGWKHIVLDGILDPDNGVDSDTDALTDWEEVDTDRISWDTDGSVILPTIQDCIGFVEKGYAEEGLTRYREEHPVIGMPLSSYVEYVLGEIKILPIYSDPTNVDTDGEGLNDCVEKSIGTKAFSIDTDGDLIDDEEEFFLGLDPLSDDTDGDLLKDGLEFALGYDPLHPNPDGDEYSDFEEYHSGKDPYVFEWETTLEEHMGAIGYGVIFGDFADDSLINTDVLIGQIGGSFFPIVSDLRDVIANAIKGDVFMMAMSGVGLVPIAGDAVKTVANLGQTIAKMGDDIPAITKLIIGVAEKHPNVVKIFGKSDEVVDAIRDSAKSPNITKESLEKIMKYADEAGISISKTSDLFKKKDNVIKGVAGVWNKGACRRGQLIDEFINKHSIGKGLGENFPVVDRLENSVLISTKSLDVGANAYKNPNRLKGRLQSYIDKLNRFETDYPKVKSEKGFKWGSANPLHATDYSSKQLELVIPNTIITPEQAQIIQEFVEKYSIKIVIMEG